VDRLLTPDPAPGSAPAGREATAGRRATGSVVAAVALALAALVFAPSAHASFLPPEMMDKAAFGLAWFVLVAVPIAGIVLFWMVHVLPEKIAHKRHHPQTDAIKVLCLLSLFFGGLLWPLAWLWAYVKPVTYKAAYGTDKHDDYFHHMGEKALAGQLDQEEIDHLREELDGLAERGSLSAALKKLHRDLANAKPAAAAAAPTATAAARAGSV
jgi:CBS domain containing-hemolysin-like protein